MLMDFEFSQIHERMNEREKEREIGRENRGER